MQHVAIQNKGHFVFGMKRGHEHYPTSNVFKFICYLNVNFKPPAPYFLIKEKDMNGTFPFPGNNFPRNVYKHF